MDYFQTFGVYVQYWAPHTYQPEVVNEQAEIVAKYIPMLKLKDDVTIRAGLPETVPNKIGWWVIKVDQHQHGSQVGTESRVSFADAAKTPA